MKRLTTVLRASPSQRRWGSSYDKSALTKEALQRQVESGFGDDAYGKALKLDAETKTIKTAVGSLPISPIQDPSWMRARRKLREKKLPHQQRMGRFNKKLASNPFAHALATPLRTCALTSVQLPRYFLQDLEVVSHPETGKPWFAPGPLLFKHLVPHRSPTEETPTKKDKPTVAEQDSDRGEAAEEPSQAIGEKSEHLTRSSKAPLTIYTLSRKAVLDAVDKKGMKASSRSLLARRKGLAYGIKSDVAAHFRPDMGDTLLRIMRRKIVDVLIMRSANRANRADRLRFVHPCSSWDEIKDVRLRESVLWLPTDKRDHQLYSTLDIEGVGYNGKMAVYDLPYLLGEEEVERLRQSSDMFRQGEIFVLTRWPSTSVTSLHMLLWRLEGYLAHQTWQRKSHPSRTSSVCDSQLGMFERFLEQVQAEDWRRPEALCSTTPAFLIHDGGGTVFAYHCLNSLDRYVYGISNPHFRTGRRFQGGLVEMGRLYADWIRSTVSTGDFPARKNADGSTDILLGGWSLGGLLSLEVTKELEYDLDVRVVGVLMIDSIYAGGMGPVAFEPWDTRGKTKTQILSQRAMAEACRMLETWEAPVLTRRRPRMILLKATLCVPKDNDTKIELVDTYRADPRLGWDEYDEGLFEEVLEVEGHHFDLFSAERIAGTTDVIREGLNRLATNKIP
ncbi:Alpha/Beta hydrolase protein [Stachybotrys elegans]|uniref:Alpha/Beta hydrolase protein n=1 Tax=Stachybotrys elegans TaxID=80388 RepID=A0A8K0SGU5_9HYPO|nr:Alpha/Beta hydrolase protein [Stachybotrys elegans]